MIKQSQLPGGRACKEGKTFKDFPKKKLDEGQKVEMEHTNNPHLARTITMDHLTEDMDYYPKLKKMEKQAMLSGFLDEFEKIALNLAQAANMAEKTIGHAGITRHVPGVIPSTLPQFKQIASTIGSGAGKRAYTAKVLQSSPGLFRSSKTGLPTAGRLTRSQPIMANM